MLFFIGWIAWSIVNGMIASANRRDVGGVVMASLFLSPLLVWFYLMAVGKNDAPPLPPEPTAKLVLPPESVEQPTPALPLTPLPEVSRGKRRIPTEYTLANTNVAEQEQHSDWITKLPIFTIGTLCIVIIIALVQSATGSSNTHVYVSASTPIHETIGKPGWISGVETCPTSNEYGQLVSPAVSLYPSAEVDPLNRLAIISHGAKIEIVGSSQASFARIRYNGQTGYVQGLYVVDYDPRTGVRPDKEGC